MSDQTVPAPADARLKKSGIYLLAAKLMYGETAEVKHLLLTHESMLNNLDDESVQLFAELLNTDDEELTVQYENLFYIPGRYYVPPYMTVYPETGDDHPVFKADHTVWFREAGIDSWTALRDERSDHLGHFLMLLHKDFLEAENTSTSNKVIAYLHQAFGLFEKQVSEVITRGFYLDVVRYLHQLIDEEKRERELDC
ncbi:molecular chaperone TorD family protein [Salisediminibacterium halotolerans]|uniref:molecular chaperone TorD family protein n=1 Tax=Salisediminibacterium halotolerans TaxID=517425 RepID=UPI000EB0A1C1|nr:molecular chaperone TorD family protein [Salisediminibacterium halotolerans]RLJ71649.1 TorA maturation chaperone TorD [Actinophytocola xinjiangensis]RPE86799.1 TorA maturation chaperone TorD [Salisediminibacterium halotolerans]TWG32862.1 TorA maturation chaperone TorD [Salisediminibacterium halotolerans]GEL06954.1 hypothetical protein SHA02_03700 [Salisediminibacterium halotolerans]